MRWAEHSSPLPIPGFPNAELIAETMLRTHIVWLRKTLPHYMCPFARAKRALAGRDRESRRTWQRKTLVLLKLETHACGHVIVERAAQLYIYWFTLACAVLYVPDAVQWVKHEAVMNAVHAHIFESETDAEVSELKLS